MEFGLINWIVLGVYLAAMVLMGVFLAGKQKTTEDFFLGGRKMPWLAVGMSMFASLTSATTYMGVPGFAYKQNIAMIFGVVTSLLVAPILVTLFYPFYRRLRVTTSYEYIYLRYGKSARYAVATLFILNRIGWLGLVLYAPALAMSVATGMNQVLAICLMGLLAVTYTVLGGLAADVWTDVVQFIIMIGGALWVAIALAYAVPGGTPAIIHAAVGTGKFDVMDMWEFGKLTALSATVGWFFVFMNDYGTDQVTVQRLLAVRTDRGVTLAIVFNAINDLAVNGLLIFVGIGVFAYFQAFPDRLTAGLSTDMMLPYYVMHALPVGVSGLVITAIFAAAMSSMDSGISSIATVVVNDFVKPMRKAVATDAADMALARWLTFAIGIVSTVAAVYAARIGNIVEMWMNIMGLFGAPVLGMFVLGMLTRRAHFVGWLVGAVAAIVAVLWLQQWSTIMAVWYFPISFAITSIVGYVASTVAVRSPAPVDLTVWRKKGPAGPTA
jgi:solute:Na+ symporter, SSS family